MGPSLSTHDTVGGTEANSKNDGEQNDDKFDDGISPQRFAIWVLLVQTPLQQKISGRSLSEKEWTCNFSRLENSRNCDADDEDDRHCPMSSSMGKCIELIDSRVSFHMTGSFQRAHSRMIKG